MAKPKKSTPGFDMNQKRESFSVSDKPTKTEWHDERELAEQILGSNQYYLTTLSSSNLARVRAITNHGVKNDQL
jgi:hypothetical protein